jgi:DNA-binding CsgD family transcriptional regulator/PAS domain-containing protein
MADAVTPHVISQLIGSIYDCALDPSRWGKTLGEIRDMLDCRTAALGLLDRRRERILLNISVGIAPHWREQMEKHAAEISEFTGRMLASAASLDEPQVVSRDVPAAERAASPYMQHCLKPQGLVDILQYVLICSQARSAVFAAGRHERQGIITEREIELGGLLLPHIRRAVTISSVLDARTIEYSRMADALDALRCAVVLADSRGAILHANRAAEDILRDGGAITRTRGVLSANAPAAAAELRAAIAIAASDETGIARTGLAILLTPLGETPIVANVLPLTGSDLRTRLAPTAVAAVFIGAPPDAADAADIVAEAFGLTPAETRVLASLLAGRTRAEIAATLGIAPTTAKSHLENIFAKTGVARQGELMRLATGLVPPTRSANSA